eukprot:671430-Pelagomonas_calceolata.AAC.2
MSFLSSSPVGCHPFGANWIKGGALRMAGCVCHRGRPQELWMQRCSKLTQTSRVGTIMHSWVVKSGKQFLYLQASCGRLAGHACMSVLSMHMDGNSRVADWYSICQGRGILRGSGGG